MADYTFNKFTYGGNTYSIDFPVTSVTLNGSTTTAPDFYAPTTVGTDGYILVSSGTGAPYWTGGVLTDEHLKWTATTTTDTYYPIQSTSTATTSTAVTINGVKFYQYYNTAGGYRRLDLGNATAYKTSGGAYGTIRLYGAAKTYYGDLVPGVLGTTTGDGHISDNRTWTLPDATGTVALTSDIPTITLNGSATTSPSFYAPTTAGTGGYLLISGGSNNAPSWAAAIGNIQYNGALQTTDITVASGDKLVVTDSSNSSKVARTSIAFSTETGSSAKYLSQAGSWESLPQGTAYTAGTGLSLTGTEFNHSNSIDAQTTQAVYPIEIDAQGHISDYGTAVTIPTKTSDLTNDSGYITSYTDEKVKVSTYTTANTVYPVFYTGSSFPATTELGANNNEFSYTIGSNVRTLKIGGSTSTGKLQLREQAGNGGTLQPTELTADRTWTLPDATGTVALTSDIPSISLNGSSTTSPSFYAPTTVGTNGYVLKSNGSGAPSWTSASLTDEKVKVEAGTLPSGSSLAMYEIPVLDSNNLPVTKSLISFSNIHLTEWSDQVQLTLGGSTSKGRLALASVNASGYNTTIVPATTITAHQTITLPDATGTVALTSDITTAVLTATDDGAGNVTLSVTGVTSVNLSSASGVSF